MPSFRERLRGALESPRAPWVILLVTLLVTLPSIQLGFYDDDHSFRAELLGRVPGSPPAWDLYRFADGHPETNRGFVEIGAFPWWTAPTLKLHFVRPLAGLLFALDLALFGDAPLGYHLHSIAWYLALVAVVGVFFRGVLPRATANLALVVFAISAAHLYPYGWISSRHLVIASVPAALGLHAFVRSPSKWRGVLAALGLAVGLAAGEIALGMFGFALAHTALSREEPLRDRLRAIAPLVVVVVGYVALYAAIGGGASASDGYMDPMSAPGRFSARAAVMLPVMLGNAIAGVPAELVSVGARAPLVIIGVVATLFVLGLARACVAAMDPQERTAQPWLVAGAVLSLVPSVGGFPGARVLLLANVGFAPLLAVMIRRGLGGPGVARRVAAGLLVLVHLVLPPLVTMGNVSFNADIGRKTEAIALGADLGPNRPRVFVIGTSDPMITMYASAILAERTPDELSCFSVLSGARQDLKLSRVGPAEIVIRTTRGPMVKDTFETLFRSQSLPFTVGEEAHQCGATFRVTAIEDGKPTEVHVLLDRPMDDPSLRFLVWRHGRLQAMNVPLEGETLDVPWEAGPLAMF